MPVYIHFSVAYRAHIVHKKSIRINSNKNISNDISMAIKNSKKFTKKETPKRLLKCICWFLVSQLTLILVLLDVLNIYSFNQERLRVIEIGVLVVLLTFFNKITLKNISVKHNKTQKYKDN